MSADATQDRAAASHAAAAERDRRLVLPEDFALASIDKSADQIRSMLVAQTTLVADERGFDRDGKFVLALALRYACEAIEWLWKNTEQANV